MRVCQKMAHPFCMFATKLQKILRTFAPRNNKKDFEYGKELRILRCTCTS